MRTSEYNKLPKWYYKLVDDSKVCGPTDRMSKGDIRQLIAVNYEYWRA